MQKSEEFKIMNNAKKTYINFIVTFLSQVILIVFGLIVPRIFLINYGSDTNGLISTISQIFTYMALLESGITLATKKALYRPIVENDKNGISYYMSITKRYYKKIAYIYLSVVLILSFIIPLILKSNVNYWSIVIYFFFEGLTGVVSFYFINTWNCLLSSDGKSYITTIIFLFSRILMFSLKILLAILSLNIALIQVGFFGISLLQLVFYYYYMKKKYNWIDYNVAPKDAKLPDRNPLIISEIAWTIFSSTDMIILSIFVSTSLSSVYSIYNMVFVAINGLMSSIYSSLLYNLGQAYSADIEKYKKMHDIYNSFCLGVMTALMCVTYILIIPFVKLYTLGVDDINYIYYWLPLFLCTVQVLSWSRQVAGNLIVLSGRSKYAVKINVLEAMTNIILSLIFVYFWGINGVALATVLALPLKVVYNNYVADILVLKRKPFRTIIIIGTNFLIFASTIIFSNFFTLNIDNYLWFIIWGIVLSLFFLFLSFVLNCIANKNLLLIFKILKKKE